MNIRKQIGPGLWLFAFLGQFTPASWDGIERVVVAEGNVISDRELADRLQVTASTISSWRRRLKRAGLLDWLSERGRGRVLFLRGVSQAFAPSARAGETDPAPKAGDPATVDQCALQAEAKAAAQQAQRWVN